MVTRHALVGDDGGIGARAQRRDARAERSHKAAPDDDVVAAGAERDLDGCGIGAKRCRHGSALPLRHRGRRQECRQRLHDVGDDGVMRQVARLHGQIGLRIDRLAFRQQAAQRLRRIGGLQQRPFVLALGNPPHQHLDIGAEPNGNAFRLDDAARSRIHECAAAGGEDLRAAVEQAGDDARLAAAEIGFAVARENIGNAHTGSLLDLGVGVDKGDVQPSGEPTADGRFARPHHTDEDDRAASQAGQDCGRRSRGVGVVL